MNKIAVKKIAPALSSNDQDLSLNCFKASPHPSFKHTTYFDVYDELFKKFKNKPITFLEIGILDGGSLFMWRKFFGKDARIIGVDLNPDAKKWEEYGFEIYIGSQSDPSFWENLNEKIGPVDIVLDDGGHTYVQQIVTAEKVLDNITEGGLLVVEDTHTSNMDGFGNKALSFINYVNIWIERINSRFGSFEKNAGCNRVWSVEIFESIVAFKINHKASSVVSEPIWNRPRDEKNKNVCFRHDASENLKENEREILVTLNQAFSLN